MSDESEVDRGRSVPGDDRPDDADGAGAVDGEPNDVLTPGTADGGDGADVAPVGPDRETALVGASPAGSARAAARRSGVRAGSTPTKGTLTKSRDVGRVTRVSLFARLRRFLREVVAELRKVIWPARNQMVTYTIVVIVFVVFMVAVTAGLDVLFAKGVLSVFG